MRVNTKHVKFLIFMIVALLPIIYLVTTIHEIGHAVVDIAHGCKNLQITLYPLWQRPWGEEMCLNGPLYSTTLPLYFILLYLGGILVTFILGAVLLYVFNFLIVKKNNRYILSFLFWFAAANLLSSVGQIFVGSFHLNNSDIGTLINSFGLNQNLVAIVGFILTVAVLYPLSKGFIKLLKILEPKIENKTIKILLIISYFLLAIFALILVL